MTINSNILPPFLLFFVIGAIVGWPIVFRKKWVCRFVSSKGSRFIE